MPDHECPECGQTWQSEAAREACCIDDNLTSTDPSRHRLSYRLSYD